MKRCSLLLTFLLCAAAMLSAESRWAFKGTVVKMQMADCLAGHHFVATMSGIPAPHENCPEYTVLGKQVVYEVVGRKGKEFMPLAQNIDFAVRKNEVVLFGHDEKVEARFIIKRMTLRADWEREQVLQQESEALELKQKERQTQPASYEQLGTAHAAVLAVAPR